MIDDDGILKREPKHLSTCHFGILRMHCEIQEKVKVQVSSQVDPLWMLEFVHDERYVFGRCTYDVTDE